MFGFILKRLFLAFLITSPMAIIQGTEVRYIAPDETGDEIESLSVEDYECIHKSLSSEITSYEFVSLKRLLRNYGITLDDTLSDKTKGYILLDLCLNSLLDGESKLNNPESNVDRLKKRCARDGHERYAYIINAFFESDLEVSNKLGSKKLCFCNVFSNQENEEVDTKSLWEVVFPNKEFSKIKDRIKQDLQNLKIKVATDSPEDLILIYLLITNPNNRNNLKRKSTYTKQISILRRNCFQSRHTLRQDIVTAWYNKEVSEEASLEDRSEYCLCKLLRTSSGMSTKMIKPRNSPPLSAAFEPLPEEGHVTARNDTVQSAAADAIPQELLQNSVALPGIIHPEDENDDESSDNQQNGAGVVAGPVEQQVEGQQDVLAPQQADDQQDAPEVGTGAVQQQTDDQQVGHAPVNNQINNNNNIKKDDCGCCCIVM